MTLETTSQINKTPSNIDVDVRIVAIGDEKYRGDIKSKSSFSLPFPVGLNKSAVKQTNEVLQGSIEQIASDIAMDGEYRGGYSKLYEQGRYAYFRTFNHSDLRAHLSYILAAGATIEISSDSYFIPWEMFYDAPPGTKVDPALFWGMRHIISRNLLPEQSVDYSILRPPHYQARPYVGLISYNGEDLAYGVKKEIDMLRTLEQQKKVILIPLPALDINKRDDELKAIKEFLSQELQVLHLACHAYHTSPSNESYLYVSDDFSIRILDIELQEFRIGNHPLVILNACLTGNFDPSLRMSNWASVFQQIGAKGVVATEFHVPDWFAAMFVEELYIHLLQGESIGKALLYTRRHFMEKGNPLGLAYALYAPPEVSIVDHLHTASYDAIPNVV